MLLKSMVLWMLKHTLLSSVNNICRNTKIGETQNFASLFLFLDILEYLERFVILEGGGVGIVVGLVIIMVLGILVALVVLVALDFIDALVF